MLNLQGLETDALMEMLSQQTAQLTAKIADKNMVGIEQYEYEISMIQAELNSRNQPKDNTTISDMGIELPLEQPNYLHPVFYCLFSWLALDCPSHYGASVPLVPCNRKSNSSS